MLTAASALFAFIVCASAASVPVTPKHPVEDHYPRATVIDNYRWLEDAASPATKAWVQLQNVHARALLDSLPDRRPILAAKVKLEADTHVSYSNLSQRNGKTFALKYAPPLEQPLLIMLTDVDDLSTVRVVFDPNAFDPTGGTSINWFSPSPDGSKVAICWSTNHSERGDVHTLNSDGTEIDVVVPRVQYATAGGSLAWLPDGHGFLYTRYPRPGERKKADLDFFTKVYRHRLGTISSTDTLELGRDFPRLSEFKLIRGESGWMFAQLANGDGRRFAYYARNPSRVWSRLSTVDDEIEDLEPALGRVYLLSFKDAPYGKVLDLPLNAIAPEPITAAKLVVPEREHVAIQSITVDDSTGSTSHLYLFEKDGGPSRIEVFSDHGEGTGRLPIPAVSSVDEFVSYGANRHLICVERYTTPDRCFFDDDPDHAVAISETSSVKLDDVEVIREFATSKDGTQIPFTIIHRRGLPLSATTPTIMTGYGDYGGESPSFSVNLRLLSDAGVTWVDTNVRGGIDYGMQWHRDGMLLNKQHSFDDFIACAERLIELGYTDANHLVIEGSSSGGLLVGAAFTQRPDLFKAAVADSGLFDMLRAERGANGQFNTMKFGTVKVAEQFENLYSYSPYHHVADNIRYPDILLLTGATDARVDLMNSRKMAARLQAAVDQKSRVLLRTSLSDGHGLNTSYSEESEQEADILAFEFDELGVTYPPRH